MEQLQKIHKGCKGCRLNIQIADKRYANCDLKESFKDVKTNDIFDCPCKTCLVKGVCNQYCGDYLTFVGSYFEYVRDNPDEYIGKYTEPQPPNTQYYVRTLKGIPIRVKFDMWNNKCEVGPDINKLKGDG